MFKLFKNKIDKEKDNDHLSLISVAALLIHSAKIDENFTEKENKIIKRALIEMGADENELEKIIKDAELKEKDSNQILEFTKEVKNKNLEEAYIKNEVQMVNDYLEFKLFKKLINKNRKKFES